MSHDNEIILIEGREIEYRRIPRTCLGAPTIVMLHEGLGSVSTWRDFPDKLGVTTGAEVLVYSRFGYGLSAVRRQALTVDYMHRAALEELPAFLEILDIDTPVLFGHSDGASIALILAGAQPQRIRGLVLEAPHVFTERISVDSIAAIQEAYEASGDLRHRLARHHSDVDASFYGWNAVWQLPEFMDWNIEEYLPGVACPALVIQGEADEYGTVEQVERIERGSGGGVKRLILDGCGHAPHRECTASVLEASKAFLKTLRTYF
ncbi:MAG: 2-succinyl-6-hydroxy-2,4-cyclohexadiene-1-carboxylate synthase [Alphaproteobacteria bacterium MarineAlpha4_Bin2]|nr:MAG: 2-succinyl-6-hydroxy-2,4-cyclohexadiene-1-carboxylate synthase [Alphaproteobacteria bacterium MarineAlpha4_Bin2]